MQRFEVTGMTCGHCVRAVTEAIHQVDPGAAVQVDLDAGEARVESLAPAEQLVAAMRAEGYEARLRAA